MGTHDTQLRANIFAAGAVLWRKSPDDSSEIEIALVHRPRYDDWSFPKGKVDPGESTPQTAVREVHEETGMRSRLGRHLGQVTYPIPGHRKMKKVEYWAAEAVSGTFEPSDECDELRWFRPRDIAPELSYPMDGRVLRSFVSRPAQTETFLLVRHGKAGSRSRFKGDDTLRPLDKHGREQAAALVPLLAAFGGTEVHSADRVRCVTTVQGYADSISETVALEPLLSEEGYAGDRDAARARARKIASRGNVPVLCSQGKVIPDLMHWWARRDGITLPAARNRKGSVWVLSTVDGSLIAADHIASPLPLVPAADR